MPTRNEYEVRMEEIFLDLIDPESPSSIYKNKNYWQVGNVYDTLLDYLQYMVIVRKKKPVQYARDINKKVLDFYGEMSGCWYDDFCWWVIALMKSYTYAPLFYPEDIARCRKFITDGWEIVNKGKPNTHYSGGAARAFDVCDQTVYKTVKPKYEGGTWQYDIFTSRLPAVICDPEHNNPIPVDDLTPPMLGPYQLSVINGLNMVMTQRLSNLKIIPRTGADLQYNFIKQWTSPAQDADDNLLNPFDSGGKYGLIRERVSKYLDESVTMTGYDPSYSSWAGDQGTFIGGLYDYYLVNKDPYCMDLITKIVTGVKEKMTMPFKMGEASYTAIYGWSGGKDAEYGPLEGPLSSDPADYSSGLGVFMRYLYYCCQDEKILSLIIRDPDYSSLIRQTAEASYWNHYPVVNEEVPMFRQFNRLASLLFALNALPLN